MRFQFSLATLLVCITVLAVVSAVCVKVRVADPTYLIVAGERVYIPPGKLLAAGEASILYRSPTAPEIAWRLALCGPASVAATLGVLCIGRRVLARFKFAESPPGPRFAEPIG